MNIARPSIDLKIAAAARAPLHAGPAAPGGGGLATWFPSEYRGIVTRVRSLPRWRKPDSNHRYRVARSRFPEVTIGSARPSLLPFRGYAAGNLRPVLLVQSRPASPVMLVHLFETREEAETWMAAW